MVSRRRAASTLGCLFMLLLVAATGYFAVNIGRPFYRYFLFRDAMRQEAKFATMRSDAAIHRRLRERAIELDLPEAAAHNLRVRRRGDEIAIYSEYVERIEFPGFVKSITLEPSVHRVF